MNIASKTHQFDFSRVSHLFEGEPLFVEKNPRDYQIQILQKTIRDMSQGLIEGRWDIATAGGKSAMALSLTQHVVMRGGRVLYLTAGNTELRNAIKKHVSYGLGHDYIQIRGEEGIEKLLQNSSRYIYATTQMLTYNERYKHINPEYFDLIIIDESQDFFGDTFSLPLLYFNCPKVYASATPFTITHHLGERVPHVYGEVTSKELEEKYGFPKRKIRNYYIQDFHDSEERKRNHSEFDPESEASHRLLNIGRRFTLLEGIIEEVIQRGGKILPFMTSVRDAEDFVRFVVPSNPILRGKVDFTAGVRGNDTTEELEEKLRSGEIQALLSKDILNTALDIPDITDVALTAPSLSLQKMIQRIGRAARPFPGKDYFVVHDMISSVFHSGRYQGKYQAIRSSQLHVLENNHRKKFQGERSEHVTYHEIILPEGVSNKEGYSYREVEIGEVEHLAFLGDKKITRDIFTTFAGDVFGVSYRELFDNIPIYRNRTETLMLIWRGNRVPITFHELLQASDFFGSFDDCKNYDYYGEIYEALLHGVNQQTTPLISKRNAHIAKDLQTEIFTPTPKEINTQTLKKLLGDMGIHIFERGDLNFKIYFSQEIIRDLELGFTQLHTDISEKTRTIITGELGSNTRDIESIQIGISLSGSDDIETMILSFISQLPDPQDMFICSDFIIKVCRILARYVRNTLKPDCEFNPGYKLGAKFLAMIQPNASENLRDRDFNIVRTAKENEVFLSIDDEIYYVMSRSGFVHAYKLVRDLEGKKYYICLNDNAVEIMRISEIPKYGTTQTVRFFDTQGENAISIGKMTPNVHKLVLMPGDKSPYNQGKITLKRNESGDFVVGRSVVLKVFDGDKILLRGYHPKFFYA